MIGKATRQRSMLQARKDSGEKLTKQEEKDLSFYSELVKRYQDNWKQKQEL